MSLAILIANIDGSQKRDPYYVKRLEIMQLKHTNCIFLPIRGWGANKEAIK